MSKPLLRKIESAFAAALKDALEDDYESLPVFEGTDQGELEAPFIRVIAEDSSATAEGFTQQKATLRIHLHSLGSADLSAHDDICATVESLLWNPKTTIEAINNAEENLGLFVYAVFATSQNQSVQDNERVWESAWGVVCDHSP